jgi:hypothetical protein
MALTDENSMVMPVAPMYGNGNGGFGNFGGDWAWIILLLLLAGNGWGNGFGGGYGGNELYPWMNQSNQVNDGFRDQMINSTINGIQSSVTSGFGDVQTSLCNGFAGVNATVNSGFANAESSANARQMANIQQAFNSQTAITSGLTNLSSQLAQCCCDNRLATANLQSVIMSENCADRQVVSDGIRDLLVANNANTQRILDTMCQDKIDAKNERIAELERQLTMANLSASQSLQTQQLLTDNLAQTNALEQYLAPVPRPAYIVQNPNCCPNNCGCGCGCN